MNRKFKKVIFFSLNKNTSDSFEKYVRFNKLELELDFELLRDSNQTVTPICFSSIESFLRFFYTFPINQYPKTTIIIDVFSLSKIERSDLKYFIIELFLSFPEVSIVFYTLNFNWLNDLGFSLQNDDEEFNNSLLINLISEFHSLKSLSKSDFISILYGKNNLFDPSNFRNELKRILLLENIQYSESNYKCLQESRIKNFGLVIDEEIRNTNMWGYALYDFGFSVLPINYEKELFFAKNNIPYLNSDNTCSFRRLIVLRDFDLQFPDINTYNISEISDSSDLSNIKSNNIYAYRGVLNLTNSNQGENNIQDFRKELWGKLPENAETFIISQNDSLETIKGNKNRKHKRGMVFTKLTLNFWLHLKARILFQRKIKDNKEEISLIKKSAVLIDNKITEKRNYYLVGLSKEIEGIYDLLNIPSYIKNQENGIKKTYKESRDFNDISKSRKDLDSHSIPPINRDIANRLLDEAKYYYENDMFLYSALNASEALEILNGLTKSLAYELLHLKVISEVKMELQTKGVGSFKQVLGYRTNNVIREIKRIAVDNKEAERNITMQIFNDLRVIFEEYEQFESADFCFSVAKKAEIGLNGINERKYDFHKTNFKNNIDCEQDKSVIKRFSIFVKNFWTLRPSMIRNSIAILFFMPIMPLAYLLFFGNDILPETKNLLFALSSILILMPIFIKSDQTFYYMIKTGTSIGRLVLTFTIINVFFFVLYQLNLETYPINYSGMIDVIITSFINEPINSKLVNFTDNAWGYKLLMLSHIILSVIYLGLFISALYRKFVRR